MFENVKNVYLVELPTKAKYLDSLIDVIDKAPIGLVGCDLLNGIVVLDGSTKEVLQEQLNLWREKAKKSIGKTVTYFPTSLALKIDNETVARYVTEAMIASFYRSREVPVSIKRAVDKRTERIKEEMSSLGGALSNFDFVHEGKPVVFEKFDNSNIDFVLHNAKDYLIKNRVKL